MILINDDKDADVCLMIAMMMAMMMMTNITMMMMAHIMMIAMIGYIEWQGWCQVLQ